MTKVPGLTRRHERGWHLSDAALEVLGEKPTVPVPLIDLPWRDDDRDRVEERP